MEPPAGGAGGGGGRRPGVRVKRSGGTGASRGGWRLRRPAAEPPAGALLDVEFAPGVGLGVEPEGLEDALGALEVRLWGGGVRKDPEWS